MPCKELASVDGVPGLPGVPGEPALGGVLVSPPQAASKRAARAVLTARADRVCFIENMVSPLE